MEGKINELADDISGLIRNFIKSEMTKYKENYDYMMNAPLFKQLRQEVETLRAENMKLSNKNNIELVIKDEVSEDTSYEFDIKYKDKSDVVPSEDDYEEVTEEDEDEDDGGLGSPQEEVTEDEEDGDEDEESPQEEDEDGGEEEDGEEEYEEVTEDEDEDEDDGGLGSPQKK